MDPEIVLYLSLAAAVLAGAAFMIGRRTGVGTVRRRELEAELAVVREDQVRVATEGEALRAELAEVRAEQEAYRMDVVEHFSGTSDLLRDLTVQYRAVYEHLTQGASTLCPEGFAGLTDGLPIPELVEARTEPEPGPELEPNADGEPPRLEGEDQPDPATRPLSMSDA